MKKVNIKPSPYRGWTLVEALMALAVTVILCSAALPSMSDMVNAAYCDALSHEALAALRLTRNEAIKRDDQVVICKATPGNVCGTDGGWDQGWVVFHDANGNAKLDIEEEVLFRREAMPSGWRMRGNGPLANYIAYQSFGNTRLVSGGFQAGTITLCRTSARPTTAARIVINSMGRPRTERVTVPDCQ